MTNVPHPNYRIVPHDRAWAAAFEAERAAIVAATGLPARHVEHIGSTAVPGLGAKPIIDVMVGVETAAEYPVYVARLAPLGYEHRGDTVPGTLYNRKEGPPRFNVHLTVFEGQFWVDHLLFRDYLRSHPDTASAYEGLKRRLLIELGPDPPAYNAGKTAFIESVLAEARRATRG